jgi:hypothetical protein
MLRIAMFSGWRGVGEEEESAYSWSSPEEEP